MAANQFAKSISADCLVVLLVLMVKAVPIEVHFQRHCPTKPLETDERLYSVLG